MPEVTLTQASEIMRKPRMSVFRWIEAGLIPARRVGIRRDIRIEIEDLRSFAKQYSYDYDESLAAKYTK